MQLFPPKLLETGEVCFIFRICSASASCQLSSLSVVFSPSRFQISMAQFGSQIDLKVQEETNILFKILIWYKQLETSSATACVWISLPPGTHSSYLCVLVWIYRCSITTWVCMDLKTCLHSTVFFIATKKHKHKVQHHLVVNKTELQIAHWLQKALVSLVFLCVTANKTSSNT